ncbi:MAG: hypothetical protein QE278_01795 [Limnobacter sp.]|nr:hypothetical protein [Limnobacter sp.]
MYQEHVQALVESMDAEILQFGYSKTTTQVLNDISQRVLGANFSQKTAAQKTELFHQVLVHWEGTPSTAVAVSIEAVRLCDQLFPPDFTESGLPKRQLDHLPKSRQPRVANYSRYGGFEGDVQVQTTESIREAVQHKVHVLFT